MKVEAKNAGIAGVLLSIFNEEIRQFLAQKSVKFKRFGYKWEQYKPMPQSANLDALMKAIATDEFGCLLDKSKDQIPFSYDPMPLIIFFFTPPIW